MILDVARMDPEGEDFEGDDPLEILQWDFEKDDIFFPTAPVHYRLHAAVCGSEVLVTGSVSTRFGGMCTRCGGPLDIEVREDEVCVSFPVEGQDPQIDLTEEERVSILLALPYNPVCRPDCEGICPRCGKRLADGPCGCGDTPGGPWESLGSLFPSQQN